MPDIHVWQNLSLRTISCAADPLFKYLKNAQGGFITSDVKWNFTKFLVDRDGNVTGRYPPTASFADIEKAILQAL